MAPSTDSARQMLRHTVATLAYRGGKAVRDVAPSFPAFRVSETARTPAEILAHIGDLLDWALRMAKGETTWVDSPQLTWDEQVARFFEALRAFDQFLASDARLATPPEKLFQGPVADALTHVGQIAMLRRMAGAPMRGENYFLADVATGRVGREQSPPRKEFD